MRAAQPTDPPAADSHAEFRRNRAADLIAVNLNTFWSIAILLLAFTPWDFYADPAHWRLAFQVRLLGTARDLRPLPNLRPLPPLTPVP